MKLKVTQTLVYGGHGKDAKTIAPGIRNVPDKIAKQALERGAAVPYSENVDEAEEAEPEGTGGSGESSGSDGTGKGVKGGSKGSK